jgi:hypothetical protein
VVVTTIVVASAPLNTVQANKIGSKRRRDMGKWPKSHAAFTQSQWKLKSFFWAGFSSLSEAHEPAPSETFTGQQAKVR